MATNDLYLLAGLALIAWITLIYFVIRRPAGRPPAPAQRRVYRTPPYYRGPFQYRKREPYATRRPFGFSDPDQQLRSVIAAPFGRKRLLNFSEFKVFRIIENDLAASRSSYRIFAQINLGEILSSPDEGGFRSINSKRVDMLIVDHGGWPVIAIEYQGEGHYQGTALVRDEIKKEALRKAGIQYVEITPLDTPEQIRRQIREQLERC